uniref:Biogenesis of lysosome-related organelles complex 1 subunit 3 n=1 Tax=Globodera rostochiensis TaxID=31243 RepID=A0A914H1E7_GLORO
MDEDNNDIEQLMFDELGDAVEDHKPEGQMAIDDSDNEDDWRDDLHLSESSEEEDDGKEDQMEKEPTREERSPAAKHYKRMGTALRESVAQFAQTAQMMSEAAKRMGDVLEATLTDMAVIQGQQNRARAEAARIDGTRLRLAVMRRDIVRPPGVSPEAPCAAAKGREKK